MGFNISGIVINKNLEKNFEELSKILNLNLEFQEEINFETASENWKDEGIVDMYFGKNGTLLFLNEDLCLNDGYSYPNANILTFIISETSMAFNFGYTENGNNIRSKMEVNGETIDEQGSKLQIENVEQDISEVIWKQIEIVFAQKFWDIQPEEKAIRFKIINSENRELVNSPEIPKVEKTEEIQQKIQPRKIESTKNTAIKNNEIYILIGLFAFTFIGLIYVIYNVFTF